ncbi:alsin isoform X2 [Bacillus rossius redtenbacheri]|uniref:alsin isoform X2 n=1 Tax=Bacillus rossius redtenbacheri TaxID=93214 RepID=UPI002FDD200D
MCIAMNKFHLWHHLNKIVVKHASSNSCTEVQKLCCISEHIFVLTSSHSLFCGEYDANSQCVTLQQTDISAVDISCNRDSLYFVSCAGRLFRTGAALRGMEEIALREDVRCCMHGYTTPGRDVKVRHVAAGDEGCLYVTDAGQLWASGHHPQLSIQSDVPRKVMFFENRCVLSACCGSDFYLVLVCKPELCPSEKDETDVDDEEGNEVFLPGCPQCIGERACSPTSAHSVSEMCPLGLPVRHLDEEQYSSSTPSRDNSADEKKSTDDSTSFSTEDRAAQQKFYQPHMLSSIEFEAHREVPVEKDNEQQAESKTVVDSSETKGEPPTVPEVDNGVKEDRKNEFFINTDAARQFLTRQLSWVSSYSGTEELFVECAEVSLVRPTQMLKQNVSSMATFVYEGVKTVGDKVVTLSRHMSGGSETSGSLPGVLTECESIEDVSIEECKAPTVPSITSSLRCDVSPFSSSTGASDRGDGSESALADRLSELVRAGSRLLSPELWSWGGSSHGQLGVGDTSKRARPTLVSRLAGQGVHEVACGRLHALAVTLDGRVFTWGGNVCGQVSQVQSSPRHVASLVERAWSVAAGDCHSLVLTLPGNVFYLSKTSDKPAGSPVPIAFQEEPAVSRKHIFCSKDVSGCLVSDSPVSPAVQDLAIEQLFLEELCLVSQSLVRPVQRKSLATSDASMYEVLCSCHDDLVSLTALNVRTYREYCEGRTDASSITFVRCVDELVRAYRSYLNAACDVMSLSGFANIPKMVEVPPGLAGVFAERLQPGRGGKSAEGVVTCALLQPLSRLHMYKCMIQSLLLRSTGREEEERRLRDALARWGQLWDEQESRRREADTTRRFWESAGRVVELLRAPRRRLVRESRSHPIYMLNSGRFSSHWFILLSDILVHVTGGSHTVHPLDTIWVEPLQDTDTLQNALLLTMPEETLTLYTPMAFDKSEWLQAFNAAIKKSLQKSHLHFPPSARTASYTFTKHPQYKDAKYTGRWISGKLHGPGKLEWVDGRTYAGQFQNSQIQGYGRMDTPEASTYEGQWKDGQQNGVGIMKYENGDMYEGHFKDGKAHGHGVYKQGHFLASVASVYIGEWVNGMKQGYGVMDDIVTGEKYLGSWANNMKHGCGLIVTLDGIYYEGIFIQDVLTGHGVMVFEDGTHYEGEFRSAGIFNGKGTLTFSSGDRLEGSLIGVWSEGIKVTGTLFKSASSFPRIVPSHPSSFGKLCVHASQKWKAVFRQTHAQLGLLEPVSRSGRANADVQRVWENVAVCVSTSHQETQQRTRQGRLRESGSVDKLDTIPQFGKDSIDRDSYNELRKYLLKAFESAHHPLGQLLTELTAAYTATYGGVRVHPLLLSHAVAELRSITVRVYEVVRLLFPALPLPGHEADLDRKFWIGHTECVRNRGCEQQVPQNHEFSAPYAKAIETVQQLKTTFSPLEKLLVIRSTFQQMTAVVQQELGATYLWTMDDLFPVFHFVVVRAQILQLGSEIHFVEDFMEPHLQNGELGIMFTTLKACYYQILQEKIILNS